MKILKSVAQPTRGHGRNAAFGVPHVLARLDSGKGDAAAHPKRVVIAKA
jgi:hypothetical protein